MLFKEFINYQNRLYWVYRRIKQSHIKEENIQDIKEFWNCDTVLKFKNGDIDSLLFLREIPELEILN